MAFVLIERIGNVRQKVLSRRIDDLLMQAVNDGVLNSDEAREVVEHYEQLVSCKRLTPDNGESFKRLIKKWIGTPCTSGKVA